MSTKLVLLILVAAAAGCITPQAHCENPCDSAMDQSCSTWQCQGKQSGIVEGEGPCEQCEPAPCAFFEGICLEPGYYHRTPVAAKLYVHGAGKQLLMNAEEPQELAKQSPGILPLGHTTGCVSGTNELAQQHHTWEILQTRDSIDYPELSEEKAFEQAKPGLGEQLSLLGQPVLTWYMVATHGTSPVGGLDPDQAPEHIPMANVTIRATVGVVDNNSRLNDSIRLGYGEIGGIRLATDYAEGAQYTPHNGYHVYRFDIPLEMAIERLPLDGFGLRVDVLLETPLENCNGQSGHIMPNTLAYYAATPLHSFLSMPVYRPLTIGYLFSDIQGDEVNTYYCYEAAWGAAELERTNHVMRLLSKNPDTIRLIHSQETRQDGEACGYYTLNLADREACKYTAFLKIEDPEQNILALAVEDFSLCGRLLI